MITFAALVFDPSRIAGFIFAGLLFGWLAGKVMQDASYGTMGELILGSVGALVGGALFGILVAGDPGFWLSILVASGGACVLIASGRIVAAVRGA